MQTYFFDGWELIKIKSKSEIALPCCGFKITIITPKLEFNNPQPIVCGDCGKEFSLSMGENDSIRLED